MKNRYAVSYLIVMTIPFTFINNSCKKGNRNELNESYTLGIWTVKAGNESEFIKKWSTFANWTSRTNPGIGKAYLLQDTENPSKFISYGTWDYVNTIKRWRESNEFKDFVSNARKLCDEFQPHTMKVVYHTK
jgi:heme-degrading monooxygenase HmoA